MPGHVADQLQEVLTRESAQVECDLEWRVFHDDERKLVSNGAIANHNTLRILERRSG